MNRRLILLAVAAGLVLVIGGLVLAAALIPEERVADAVARRAEAALGQPVAIERVGIALFPLPGVRLVGLSVGRPDSTALVRVDHAELRVRLLPLFGRRIVVRTLDLERPRIAVEIDSAGIANFPVIEGDTTAGPAGDIAFAVERVRITDGAIRYVNHQNGSRVRLDGWSQQLGLSGTVEEGALSSLDLDGWVEFDDVVTDLPGAVLPTRDLGVRVSHDASLDLETDVLELRSVEISLDGVTVAGTGRIQGLNSGRPDVSLDLAAEGLDAGRLMDWAPDSLRARMALGDRPIGLRGTASLRTAVNGTVAPDTLPAVDGTLSIANAAVTVGQDVLLEAVQGEAAFSLDSVVARFEGQALGDRFDAGVAVRDPAAPMAVVALSGRGNLDHLARLGLVSDTLGLFGSLRVDLRTQVPLEEPGAARALGTIDAVDVQLAGMDPVVRVPVANARFDGGQVRVNPLRVELGPDRTPLELDITARDWIPALTGAEVTPRIVAVLEAGTLDLDALFGPPEGRYPELLFARLADRRIQGRRPEEVARELGMNLPPLPAAQARIEARIDELVRNDLHYTSLEAVLEVNRTAVDVERLRFGLMGGTVEANGRLEPGPADTAGAPTVARLMGQFAVTNVGAGPFFDVLTPFRDHLDGRLDLVATVGMDLDRYVLPERSSVEASGALAIAEGRLANWTVLRGVADRLDLTAFDTLWFRDWAGAFHIDGPRVNLEETALRGRSLDARAAGWFDFAGHLDLAVAATLTEELARRAGAIGDQILAATGGAGVPIGLRIQGTAERPAINLDLSPAREAVTARAEEAVRAAADSVRDRVEGAVVERAGQLLGQAGYELPDSLRGLPADSLRAILGDSLYTLLPDSVKLQADSLQNAIQNALRERLRRLLPGGGGGDGGSGGGR